VEMKKNVTTDLNPPGSGLLYQDFEPHSIFYPSSISNAKVFV